MRPLEYLIGALMLAVIIAPLIFDWWRRSPKQEPSPWDREPWGDGAWPSEDMQPPPRRDV